MTNTCSTCKHLERKPGGRQYKHAWCNKNFAQRVTDGYLNRLTLAGTMPEEFCCRYYEAVEMCEKCGRPL